MSTDNNPMGKGENLIYDAVKDMTNDELEQTVRKNAAARNFVLSDEHMSVIHTLIEHYKQDCRDDHACFTTHVHMRFLEEAYKSKGGGKYLYMLFDAMPGTRGVLMPIHELAGLPALRLDSDKGFGTTF